jgi:restriction system protein
MILTLEKIQSEAHDFLKTFETKALSELYGSNDGKAVGTFVEHGFHEYLSDKGYIYERGSSASGIDFPELGVDVKVTSIKQPQSSCPFRNASQKVYGLGYHLLVMVYDKADNHETRSSQMRFVHAVFVHAERTGDYQTTQGIHDILIRKGNADDISAYLQERNLPLDEIGLQALTERIMESPPCLGYLTISNALQWRLQYHRIIAFAKDKQPGTLDLLS